jgi:hypothetical protein
MRVPRLLAAAALVLGCTVLFGRPLEEADPPAAAPPVIVTVVEVRADRGELICEQLVLEQFMVRVPGKDGDKKDAATVKSLTKALRTKLALKDCEVHTAGGKKLTDEEAGKRLSTGTTLLLAFGSKPGRPYLQILREDTLILVSKTRGAPLKSDPVPPSAENSKEDKEKVPSKR